VPTHDLTSVPGDTTHLLECSDCGLLQRVGPARISYAKGRTSVAPRALNCARCGGRLPGGPVLMERLAIVSTATAALLLLIGLSEPLFDMYLAGRFSSAGVLTGPRALVQRGLPELAVVVVVTLMVAPLAHLAILGLSLVGNRLRRPGRFWFMPLGMADVARHWSMADVFLLGALVCYVRLRAWGQVDIGAAVGALAALRLVTISAESAIDRTEMWQRMPWHRPMFSMGKDRAPRRATSLITCGWCGLLSEQRDGAECPRCGRTVRARKRNSIARTSALLVTAGVLTVPANALPVMEIVRFGRPNTDTIYSGVVELLQHNLLGLAVVIFVASIVIPLIKVVVLGLLLWTTAHGRTDHLQLRTRAFRFVHYIGRWSMVDVFAVTVLVSLVHVGVLASVLPRYGAVAFCAVVILTMWATDAFDPRLMWDAAGKNGPEKQRRVR
jgi:paraquat-inducible protein A